VQYATISKYLVTYSIVIEGKQANKMNSEAMITNDSKRTGFLPTLSLIPPAQIHDDECFHEHDIPYTSYLAVMPRRILE